MPLEASVFPQEVQVAFFMHQLISDRWDGMSGTYLGKNWIETVQVFDLYEIDDRKEILFFMQLYDGTIMRYRSDEQQAKRKAEERKRQQASGKTYTHNVKG
tara:strand:+ start:1649 stop:1951 length:303 start_codon:yes stop_codon:yes gene_type:complete